MTRHLTDQEREKPIGPELLIISRTPIEDDLFEVRVKNVFESAEGKILVSMDNSPRTP